MEPHLVTSDDKHIKRLLRKQGTSICRTQITQSLIESSIEKFDYGFVFMTQKAMMGQSMLKLENRFKISGFVLMGGIDEIELHIHLICVDENQKGDGTILMNSALKFATDNDYLRVTLYALPEPSLVIWYRSFGFQVVDEIYKNGQLKVYAMTKVI
jgi:ribosomal protein S18 acetylase RimI-like enzyme